MKIHLAWIRVTAAAIVAGLGVHPAAAQYAPFRPVPQQPAAPQPAPAAAAPAPAYVAYRTQPAYQPVPAAQYQAPATAYRAPVAPAYRQPVAPYPQTAMGQYPAAYGVTPYVAQQSAEAIPAPKQPAPGAPAAAPATEATPAATEQAAPSTSAASGYPAAGCNCGAGGYTAAGCGANGSYPDISGYFGDSCNENIWFGGVYFLYMDRVDPSPARLSVEVDHNVAPDPYYPPKRVTVMSTQDVEYDYRPGVEVRLGSTFTIGDSCSTCNTCGSGYGYPGCGCNSCAPACSTTTYAWEVAWWGLDNDANWFVFEDQVGTRMYGMKSFAGLEYDRDGAGAGYAYRPVNDYYDYQMPIPAPPGAPLDGYTSVLAQRVWTDFRAQNLELNVIRFPMCDTCGGGCGGGGCGSGYDASGCGGNYTGCNTCGGCEEDCWTSHVSMYGSCGVRYFRIDDDFAYDTEFLEWVGGAPDQAAYNGFTYDNSNELCYDIQIENNLVGPQVGWTTNYCVGCKWNFFCNSTFGIFDNHMTQWQRMWSGGGGAVRFTGTGESFNVRSSKDTVAFLGELRLGGSYDVTCHWRAVAAYRAVAMTGIATSVGQIPDQFSSRADVANIDADGSMVVHGVQVGGECRY